MSKTILQNVNSNPFLRWTGSKRWFTSSYLHEFLPDSFENYHEPFLGAGSVFFHLKNQNQNTSRQFYLSDINKELINVYTQIKENPNSVITYLKKMKNDSESYYKIRDERPRKNEKKAARFIYLNKTSFNGIYRVNSKGIYNVPYGKRKNVDIINEKLLLKISEELRHVKIECENFDNVINNIKAKDLVFLDPPYTVAHENNGFIEYNQKLFSWDDQVKLKKLIEHINDVGAYFILTNASHKSITDLYDKIGKSKVLSRYSQVGGRNKTRGVFNEIVIYNTRD